MHVRLLYLGGAESWDKSCYILQSNVTTGHIKMLRQHFPQSDTCIRGNPLAYLAWVCCIDWGFLFNDPIKRSDTEIGEKCDEKVFDPYEQRLR